MVCWPMEVQKQCKIINMRDTKGVKAFLLQSKMLETL